MILNQQSQAQVELAPARAWVRRLRSILGLDNRDFNVCFVDDERIAKLNRVFRGKPHPTDVLSFPWEGPESYSVTADGAGLHTVPPSDRHHLPTGDFHGFLGDVVISVEAAERNAQAEGHALRREIDWLILHGLLHLLGMDHERDHGEMVKMEYDLRARLGRDGAPPELAVPKAAPRPRNRARRSQKHRSRRGRGRV